MTSLPRLDLNWSYYCHTVLEFQADVSFRVDLRQPLTRTTLDTVQRLRLGSSWAVVTAHNPRGRVVSAQENDQRHAALREVLAATGLPMIEVNGLSPDEVHREAGYAIPLTLPDAVEVATRFEQSAVFWFDGEGFWLIPVLESADLLRLPSRSA